MSKSSKPRYFYGWTIVAVSFFSRIAYAEHFTSILGLFIKPMQSEFGWSRSAVAGVQSVARLVEAKAIAGLVAGFLAEHADKASVRIAPFMAQALGVFFLFLGDRPVLLWLGVFFYGGGTSGVNLIQEVVWANYFGRLSLGTVRSLGYFMTFGLGAAGPVAMNAVYDVFGSYRLAFFVIIASCVVAAFLLGIVQPAKAKHFARADDDERPFLERFKRQRLRRFQVSGVSGGRF